jgi:outer membrane receptor protein involved in Fe transport
VCYFDENLKTKYEFQDVSPFGFSFFNGGKLDTKSYAAFGQLGYDFRDAGNPFRIVGGVRYTKDEENCVIRTLFVFQIPTGTWSS